MVFQFFRPKYKRIVKRGKTFLHRLSFPTRDGSIKLHLILRDDVDEPHIHPWEFTSFLAFGAYKELVEGVVIRHLPFSIVKNNKNRRHKVLLYRLFGIPLPCITIGKYSKKIQLWCEHKELCDGCKPLGHCMDKKYWHEIKMQSPRKKI